MIRHSRNFYFEGSLSRVSVKKLKVSIKNLILNLKGIMSLERTPVRARGVSFIDRLYKSQLYYGATTCQSAFDFTKYLKPFYDGSISRYARYLFYFLPYSLVKYLNF